MVSILLTTIVVGSLVVGWMWIQWWEIVRTAIIVIGSYYLFRRYWPTSRRYEEKQYDPPPVVLRGTVYVLSLAVLYTLSFFTPYGLGDNAGILLTTLATMLGLAIFTVTMLATRNKTRSLRSGQVDGVISAVAAMVASYVLVTSVLFDRRDGRAIEDLVRIVQYLAVWFGITRFFLDQSDDFEQRTRTLRRLVLLVVCIFALFSAAGLAKIAYSLALDMRGTHLYEAGDRKSALELLQDWADLNKTLGMWSQRGLESLGALYHADGESTRMDSVVRVMASLHDDAGRRNMSVGGFFFEVGEWSKAIESYLRVDSKLEADTINQVDVEERLAVSFLKGGFSRLLLDRLRSAGLHQLAPTNPGEERLLGTAHALAGEPEIGSGILRQSASIENQWHGEYLQGRARMAQGAYRTGVEYFSRCVELKPDHADSRFKLAFCHEQLGEFETASRLYAVAAQLLPNHLQALHGQLRTRIGDEPSNRKIERRIQSLTPTTSVNVRMSDDLWLVGYDLPSNQLRWSDAADLSLYWRVNEDTLSTPDRVYIGLADPDQRESLSYQGAYFAPNVKEWQIGEVVKTEHQLRIEEPRLPLVECDYRIELALMYTQEADKPANTFRFGDLERWAFSPSLFIDGLCLVKAY